MIIHQGRGGAGFFVLGQDMNEERFVVRQKVRGKWEVFSDFSFDGMVLRYRFCASCFKVLHVSGFGSFVCCVVVLSSIDSLSECC